MGVIFGPWRPENAKNLIAWTQFFFSFLIEIPNFASFELAFLPKWPTPQIKGLITAISEYQGKFVSSSLK